MLLRVLSARTAICVAVLCVSLMIPMALLAQSTATLRGTVTDESGAVVPNATITARNQATGIERTTVSDSSGNYQLASLPIGTYDVDVKATGMAAQTAKGLVLNVSQTVTRDFKVGIKQANEVVNVNGEVPVVETSTMTVGQVVDQRTVQEIPLNGRHFVDLGLLIPGSVTPPSNGFLTAPTRGQGSSQFNTAGQREDTVNFMVNGVNLNDMVQNQITFQPSINTVSEFKVDNSTYSAEYGRNSGAIVNVATRSGSNQWHGEAFDFLRNNAFDARNYFNREPQVMSPFKRNQFGANIGGPIWKNHTFFFFSYEGLRQRQGLTVSSGVPTDQERTGVTDPTILKLLDFIPRANSTPVSGQLTKFSGSATAPVNLDQWTGDVSHNFSEADRLHVYYAIQRDLRQEPTIQGNTITGFGDTRQAQRQIATINETHVFTTRTVNEFRLGFNRVHITFAPNFVTPGSTLGVGFGQPTIGIPQISVSGYGLNFGGPAGFPQGRGDTTAVLSDTLSYIHGNHNFKFGGEYRRFINDNFGGDTGSITFTSPANFLAGNLSTFNYNPGTASRIHVNTISGYVMDNWKVTSQLTLELGLRYDFNMRPSEAQDRFVTFVPGPFDPNAGGTGIPGFTGNLARAGDLYQQNTKDLGPRVGFAYDVAGDGKTVVRAGYGLMFDQPVTNSVTPLTSNPPFATPLSFNTSGATIPIGNIAGSLVPGSIGTISMINPNFAYPYVQSYNVNIQRQLTNSMGLMVGYFGAKGTHLRNAQNLNQRPALSTAPRPFPRLSPNDPFKPNATLANITEITSNGYSNYNALWVTATKHMAHGLEFMTSYTYSKSMDTNSLSSQGVVLQDSNNISNNYGPSDFDAKHRIVVSGIYDVPFMKNSRWLGGWEATTVFQAQTGNPFTIVTASNWTGLFNNRPIQVGDIPTGKSFTSSGVYWFNVPTCNLTVTPGCVLFDPNSPVPPSKLPSPFTATFGTMSRNALRGPGFENLDLSAIKNTKITERLTTEFRVEAFNLLNHPNLAQPITPGFIGAATPSDPSKPGTFGQITSTRFPTGDAGSSRQLQFALKFKF